MFMMCPRTWRATVMILLVASQMMLGPLTSTGIVAAHALEDDEIEDRLSRLNKPAVKSIKLEDGEIIDCVEIYKQPAFDHPLLKDHKIQLSPSFWPKMAKSEGASDPRPPLQPLWRKSEDCPEGTIPIRRVQRDELIGATSAGTLGRRRVAGIGTIETAEVVLEGGGPYGGTEARINVWGVPVERNEWSNGRMELSDGKLNFIEAGWMVNPQLHRDGNTRLYTCWTADGGDKIGCFNMLCPGFVQVGKGHVLGVPIGNLSVYEGPQYDVKINIIQDNWNDNWWVLVDNEFVGYWAVSLFGEGGFPEASRVSWGGGVLNMNNGGYHTTTKMGSGHYSWARWNRAAYVKDVTVRMKLGNGSADSVPPRHDLLKVAEYNVRCYSAVINQNPHDNNFMYFGGPGGRDCVALKLH